MKVFFTRSFLKFTFVGGVAAAVNFISRIFIHKISNFNTAIISAYLIAMITSFFLMKAFVFSKTKNSFLKSGTYFVLVNMVGIFLCWFVSIVFAYYILPQFNFDKYRFEVAHALGIMAPTFTSFLGHKYLSFRD